MCMGAKALVMYAQSNKTANPDAFGSGTGAHTYKVCKSVSAAILHLGSASKFRHVLVDRLRILASKAR